MNTASTLCVYVLAYDKIPTKTKTKKKETTKNETIV